MDGDGLGGQDHQHAGQVPVGEAQEAGQRRDGYLRAEELRAVQADQEEREEEQPGGAAGNGGRLALEHVEGGEALADQVEHVVGSDEDDGVPVPEGRRVHVLGEVAGEDGEGHRVDEEHAEAEPFDSADDPPQGWPPGRSGERRVLPFSLLLLRLGLEGLVVADDRQAVRHVVAEEAEPHEDDADGEVEVGALPQPAGVLREHGFGEDPHEWNKNPWKTVQRVNF